jgi:poly-gamma-glutamate capsule biosynthesis protein CapA/YwtB (metallophosphatase superfamily)
MAFAQMDTPANRQQIKGSSAVDITRRPVSRRTVLKGAAGTGLAVAAPLVRKEETAGQEVSGLPAGMALITSPRLPLFGVGSGEVESILTASVPDWREVGSPISLPIEPIALSSQITTGMTPAETFDDYNALAAELDVRPGAVALVPVEQVDFRANVLSVDGFDPLRDADVNGERAIRIGVVGDIVPGRNVHNKMIAFGDFTHPFQKVAAELGSYDLTFANLEGNLSPNIEPPEDPHTFSFVSDPAMIDGLKLAGIDAVSLANNHSTWNSEGWGVNALLDTLDSLDAAGFSHFGGGREIGQARQAWVSEIAGKRIAIIGIDGVTANEEARADGATVWLSEFGGDGYAGATGDSPGTNPYILDDVLSNLESLVSQYDIVIPYFHFGIEYVAVPPDWAVEGARAAIDAGATMVVTNHPHVVQGMEVYNGKPIVYSVGNFIFDQMFSVDVRQGQILEIVVRESRVVGLRFRGVEIEDFNQPRLMTSGEHASQMDRFWSATDRLANQ